MNSTQLTNPAHIFKQAQVITLQLNRTKDYPTSGYSVSYHHPNIGPSWVSKAKMVGPNTANIIPPIMTYIPRVIRTIFHHKPQDRRQVALISSIFYFPPFCFSNQYSKPSARASQLASMMLVELPTVRHSSTPSLDSIRTRT